MMKRVLALLGIIVLIASCEKKEQEVPVSSVSITQATAEMIIGETIQLSATISPSNASERSISWASSKVSVATVSNGKVTAIAEGSSTITASCGGKSATCQVTVSKGIVAVTSITLNKESISLNKGESETLSATVKPDDATDKTVTWSSSESAIASVDNNGKVTAVAGGSAVITAKAGDKQATCTVTVTVPVESISLDRESLTLVEEGTATLVATVKPDDATDKAVAWSSSDSQIATVDETGKVMAIKEGEATIIATAGEKTANCKVTVNKKVIAVESVSLDKTTLSLFESESAKLAATVKPDDASDKTVTWSSSSTEIASVDQEGNVKAIKAGSATITAKAGEKQATCQVTVQEKPKVTSITIKTDSFNGYIGKDYPVEVTISPENAQYDLEWTTSDSRVASIQGSGLSVTIHTLDYGKSDIQVKDKISGKSASITVSTVVTDFVWSESTSEKYSGYPLITIEVGEEHQLKYSCTPNSATKLFSDLAQFVFYEPTVVVSTPSCISFSEDGVVRGIKEGTVGIKPTGRIIKGSSESDRIYFKVKQAAIPVESITLDKEALTLEEGSSATLVATVKPDNASDITVIWSSSDTQVATVDENGKVTAIKVGTAIITAKVGDKKAECLVTVESINPNSIKFADPNVKEKLVAAFDTNHDGNLSYEEAAAVTSADDIKAALGRIKTYKSFDEFKYFVGIESVVKEMFTNWNLLSSVTLPKQIQRIEDNAFKGCIKLSSITIPEGVTAIGASVFSGCTSLTSIRIPEGVVTIGSNVFSGCERLALVSIPKSISRIGDYAFFQCTSLTSVDIPGTISFIGKQTFYGCSNLRSIAIPNSVLRILDCAFKGCEKLEEVYISSLTSWLNINFQISNKYTYTHPFEASGSGRIYLDGSELTDVIIPEGVTSIRYGAFYGCASLRSITLPESLLSIDGYAFKNCSNLISINIPERVSTIRHAFVNCKSLTSITIPESVTDISGAFENCSNLTSITIPESVTDIRGAFWNCTSLTSIIIPESVTLMAGAFEGCTNLREVNIPESVTDIDFAFCDCASLTSITIPESVISMSQSFLRCTGLTTISIPSSVNSMYHAFVDCTNLSNVSICEGITKIEGTFENCTSLTSITIPKSVTNIDYASFRGCTNLATITIPESVTSIGNESFRGCTNLATITIPAKTSAIGEYSFWGCNHLQSFIIKASSVPIGGRYMLDNTNNCPIYVPKGSVDAYKSADYWKNYSNRIQAIQ